MEAKDWTAVDSGSSRQRITVVVCTYNRANLLPGALQSLLRLDVPDDWQWDVLVVDNNSSDATAQVVADLMRANDGRLHYVLEPEPGVAAARNCGIARSSGDWVAFFDDDQIADQAWLRELLEFASSNDFRVVSGGIRLLLPAAAPDLPPEALRLFAGQSDQERSRPGSPVSGGNSLFHRSVFEQIGTFDTSLGEAGEDTDLTRRLGKAGIATGYDMHAIVHHRVTLSRLETLALLAASRRVGWGFARRDYRTYGGLRLMALCCGRLLLLSSKGAIRYARAAFAGDRRLLLGARIDAARTRGYCAGTAACILSETIRARLGIGEPSFRDEFGRTSSQVNTGQG